MAAKKGKKKAGSGKRTTIVVGKHHKKRTRSKAVGATHHHKPRKKRHSGGMLGSTGTANMKQIAIMAIGVAAGAGITHIILRPVEKRLADKWPMVGKFLAAGEVFLGGVIALKGKHSFTKSLGVGILAGGVHGLMKQANIYKNIPGISGPGDYTEVHVPISGSYDSMIAGILEDGRRDVRTNMVARTNHTSTVAETEFTSQVAGEWDEVLDYPVKG